MKILELNNDLKEPWTKNNGHLDLLHSKLKESYNYDYATKLYSISEDIYADTIPDNAALYHKNYLEYLRRCYHNHYNYTLSPHVIWYTFLKEIADMVVADPETYRTLFTTKPEGKTTILLPGEDGGMLDVNVFMTALESLVPTDTNLFFPQFTTATPAYDFVSKAVFMETVSPYYNYMTFACGFPKVKVEGTEGDWNTVLDSCIYLRDNVFKETKVGFWLNNNAVPAAFLIRQAYATNDVNFFRDIYKDHRCGSGSQIEVDETWFTCIFGTNAKGANGIDAWPSHICKVPYTTLPTNRKWKLVGGLFYSTIDADGFYKPDFAAAQVQVFEKPIVLTYEQYKERYGQPRGQKATLVV